MLYHLDFSFLDFKDTHNPLPNYKVLDYYGCTVVFNTLPLVSLLVYKKGLKMYLKTKGS